jgi:hypothetical protein
MGLGDWGIMGLDPQITQIDADLDRLDGFDV